METGVNLLLGPPASGKTTLLLERYHAHAVSKPLGDRLWLAPTERAAAEVRKRLSNMGSSAMLQPGVTTFSHFAEQVILRQTTPYARITPVQKRWLLRGLIQRFSKQGQLSHYRRIVDTRGFLDYLDAAVRDLKQREWWPEAFPPLIREGQGAGRELWLLYNAYQQMLISNDLYDLEGSFWWAQTALRQEQAGANPTRLELLVVDGFSDFTTTQLEILTTLSIDSKCCWISLPCHPQDARKVVFDKALQSFDQLKKQLRKSQVHTLDAPHHSVAPSLQRLSANLFGVRTFTEEKTTGRVPALQAAGNTRNRKTATTSQPVGAAPERAVSHGVVQIIASTMAEEARLVAEQIKRLIVASSDDAGACLQCDDIMIAVRSWGAWPAYFRQAFSEFGIPLAIEKTSALAECPVVSALLRTLRLQTEDWRLPSLFAVLQDGYFRPNWDENRGDAVFSASLLVRQLRFAHGRDELLDQAAMLYQQGLEAQQDDRTAFTHDEDGDYNYSELPWLAISGYPLLLRLKKALEQLPKQATLSQWGMALRQLSDELGYTLDGLSPRNAQSEDAQALSKLWRLLASVDEVSALTGDHTSVSLQELPDTILELAQREQAPCDHRESGKVRVLTAQTARSLRAKVVFIVGLQDGEFPAASREENDAASHAFQGWRPTGAAISTPLERSAAEMLLFLEMVASASERLYLSWSARDTEGRSVGPSPFLEDVWDALGEKPHTIETAASGATDTSRGQHDLWSSKQARTAAVRSLLQDNPLPLAALTQQDQSQGPSRLLAALELQASRTAGIYLGPHEGVFESGAKELSDKFGGEHLWSTTQFERYAQCPFLFFADYVLKLRRNERLELQNDNRRRGTLLHQVLSRYHRHAAAFETNAELVADESVAASYLDEAWKEIAEKTRWYGPVDRALLTIDQRWIAEWLKVYPRQYADYTRKLGTPKPWLFEASFGDMRQSDGEKPIDNALTLKGRDQGIRVRGRIDRVDKYEQDGRVRFTIVDYKTRKDAIPVRKRAFDQDLQLAIYAIAVEEIFGVEVEAKFEAAGYWLVQQKGFHPVLQNRHATPIDPNVPNIFKPPVPWDAARAAIVNKVLAIVADVRQGRFPVYNADLGCQSTCRLSKICRVNTIRSLERKCPPTTR